MSDPKENLLMEKIVSLCKRRGFIYQSSEIYGGINGFWDYGPLGTELKRNVKESWWTSMTRLREDVVGLDATIIMAPQIWKASGHVDTFADMMTECPACKKRYRVDQVEPRSGRIYRCEGGGGTEIEKTTSSSPDSGTFSPGVGPKKRVDRQFAVLVPLGKPIESGRQKAENYFFNQGLVNSPVPFGEVFDEEVRNTSEFCPDVQCGAKLMAPRPFNLMLQTYVGPIQSDDNIAYLRPETAQAIFAQFKNVFDSSRVKLPFGIAQIGKAFRNEVTPRNFTFRSREFEQMELEFFIKPDEVVEAICGSVAGPTAAGHPGEPQPNWGWQMWHQYWVEERVAYYERIGLSRATLGFHNQSAEELAHYARACTDILFKFPFSKRDEKGDLLGEELEGIAARSDFDLSQHERHSGKLMGVFDEELRTAWGKLDDAKKQELSQRYYQARLKCLTKTGVAVEKAEVEAKEDADGLAKGQYIPHVIEPSAGADRLILALIANAYSESTSTDDKGKSETRVVMKFHPRIAPIKLGVFPLMKNKPELVKKAQAVRDLLRPWMNVFYDDAGAIGRRYARQDEAGTPFCVTIDFDTLGEKLELLDTVTLRDRDTTEQTRVKISELLPLLLEKIR